MNHPLSTERRIEILSDEMSSTLSQQTDELAMLDLESELLLAVAETLREQVGVRKAAPSDAKAVWWDRIDRYEGMAAMVRQLHVQKCKEVSEAIDRYNELVENVKAEASITPGITHRSAEIH